MVVTQPLPARVAPSKSAGAPPWRPGWPEAVDGFIRDLRLKGYSD